MAVVGGGIAGLSAARRIRQHRPDATVTVYESAAQIGGKLRRVELGGQFVDVGAEAMLARRPEGIELAIEAGLGPALIHPNPVGALVRSRGGNHALPARTVLGIPSDVTALADSGVVSQESVDRVAAELAGPPLPAIDQDVSIGDLVEQRLGEEIVDRLLDPLLGGVYAGHARAISLRAASPALAGVLASGSQSLVSAARAVLSAPASTPSSAPSSRPSNVPPSSAPAGPVFASLAGGLAQLPERLATDAGLSVRTGQVVRAVERTTQGFRLTIGPTPTSYQVDVDAVVIATPAPKAAQLLATLAPGAATELATIELASMAIVTLAFDTSAERVGLPPGSGILVPAVEKLDVKAMTFSSQKWAALAGTGISVMRASLGRAGEEWTLQRPDEELVSIVRRELATMTGVSREPIESHVQRWGGGLPQYAVGHADRVARVRARVAEIPGLAVCGATYDGVGIPACIASAHTAADQILNALTRSAE